MSFLPRLSMGWVLALVGSPSFAQSLPLYQFPSRTHSRVSSMENLNGLSGNGGQANYGAKGSAFTSLKAGASIDLLNIQHSGIIERVWITVSDRSAAMLRSLRLRLYWDGAQEPAVDVPIGDFFCAALGNPIAFESALFTNPEGRSFNCYIPMPFRKGARVTLTNESKTNLELLFFDVDFVTLDKPDTNAFYFHASWSHQHPPVGQDVELLPTVSGKGRFLGVSVGVQTDTTYGNTWWGEGEVKMYLDDDQQYPTINGTGAEDYIGTGWFMGTFAHQYQGCLVSESARHQYAFYRFHIPDAIYFNKRCRVTIQQMGGWFAPVVKDLMQHGVALQPVSLSRTAKRFRGLMNNPNAGKELQNATADDWLNFYRSDDYFVTAYFYLNSPTH